MPNYGQQKAGKPSKAAPPHKEHNEPGGPANPYGEKADARAQKAALVARMKAAAEKAKGG